MSAIAFEFIGWCHGGVHDKVWTAFTVGGSYYAGWGRRGKTLSFKKHDTLSSLWKVINKKDYNAGGEYKQVDSFYLFSLFPNFEDDVEKYLTFATLANKVR